MDPSTAITLYENMALERAVDAVMKDVGRGYDRKRDALFRAIRDVERERDPHGENCPMCGGALAKPNDAPQPPREREVRDDGLGLTGKLVAGMSIAAMVVALAAAGYKVAKRSRSDRLVALLRAQPGRPIGELATELYGKDSETERAKTRALLAQLARLGRLRNVSHGRWEAVDGDEEVVDT